MYGLGFQLARSLSTVAVDRREEPFQHYPRVSPYRQEHGPGRTIRAGRTRPEQTVDGKLPRDRCRLDCILLKMVAISMLSTGLPELRASLCASVCLPGSNEQVRALQGWHYRDNDFFQELWMQLAASGTGQFCKLSTGLRLTSATAAVD